MPSFAPGSRTLLTSRENRRTYGNKAVKYTTCEVNKKKKDFFKNWVAAEKNKTFMIYKPLNIAACLDWMCHLVCACVRVCWFCFVCFFPFFHPYSYSTLSTSGVLLLIAVLHLVYALWCKYITSFLYPFPDDVFLWYGILNNGKQTTNSISYGFCPHRFGSFQLYSLYCSCINIFVLFSFFFL